MRRALAAALLVLTACGSATAPVEIPEEELPFPLQRAVEPEVPANVTLRFSVAFVGRNGLRLVNVQRELRASAPPAETVVRALLAGPTDRERARGIGTVIPEATRLLSTRLVDDVAEVDLSSEFQAPASSETIVLRVAQVVWTLAALREVTAVRFAIDGQPVSVRTANGRATDRPVTGLDYATVAPRGRTG